MKRTSTLLAALGVLSLAAACQLEPVTPIQPPDDDPEDTTPIVPPGGPVTEARGLFDANVRGLVQATCNTANGACHTIQDPAFVNLDPGLAYDTIKLHGDRLFPAYELNDAAKLLTNGIGGAHYGADFTQADLDAINAWLSAERAEGGVVVSALAIWSGCMNLAEWEAEGVADAWADKNANGQGNCDTCHNLGADGFMASNQDERVFNTITQNPALMPSYFTLDATGTQVIINTARFESVGTRQAPHQEHGNFDVDGQAMENLQSFYDLTKARMEAGLCAAPRFPQ